MLLLAKVARLCRHYHPQFLSSFSSFSIQVRRIIHHCFASQRMLLLALWHDCVAVAFLVMMVSGVVVRLSVGAWVFPSAGICLLSPSSSFLVNKYIQSYTIIYYNQVSIGSSGRLDAGLLELLLLLRLAWLLRLLDALVTQPANSRLLVSKGYSKQPFVRSITLKYLLIPVGIVPVGAAATTTTLGVFVPFGISGNSLLSNKIYLPQQLIVTNSPQSIVKVPVAT